MALVWLSYLQRAGVTNGKKMALRLTVSPNRWCDKRNADGVGLTFLPSKSWCEKRNTDGAETDFLTFCALVWQKEHRWRWDWLSHLQGAGVTNGTGRWCDKWNTDGAETDFLTFWALVWVNTDGTETDFLTFWALVWQKEHRWRWWQQLIPQWWPPLSDLSS